MKRIVAVVFVVASGCSPPPVPGPSGPPPSGTHFSFDCLVHGVGAFDHTRTLFTGLQLPCTVRVADRTGAALGGVSVQVLSEAGRVDVPGPTAADGTLTVTHETGMPLPVDVEPATFSWTPTIDANHTGSLVAPEWMVPFEWMENPALQLYGSMSSVTLREPRRPDPIRLTTSGTRYVNNPRDNLVTMIAVVEGEEAFEDLNSNGTRDEGEPFTDLTEPFVDENDDGTRTDTEPFIDVNGNGTWDGKNGAWDATTRLWVQERILWTGVPAFEDTLVNLRDVPGARSVFDVKPRQLEFVCFDVPCTGGARATTGEPMQQVSLYLADPWFNPIARTGAPNDCVVLDADLLPVVITRSTGDFTWRVAWPAGEVMVFDVEDRRRRSDAGVPAHRPESFDVRMTCRSTTSRAGLDGGIGLSFMPFSGTIQ